MFLVGLKVISFMVKGVSHILRGSKGVGATIESYGKALGKNLDGVQIV